LTPGARRLAGTLPGSCHRGRRTATPYQASRFPCGSHRRGDSGTDSNVWLARARCHQRRSERCRLPRRRRNPTAATPLHQRPEKAGAPLDRGSRRLLLARAPAPLGSRALQPASDVLDHGHALTRVTVRALGGSTHSRRGGPVGTIAVVGLGAPADPSRHCSGDPLRGPPREHEPVAASRSAVHPPPRVPASTDNHATFAHVSLRTRSGHTFAQMLGRRAGGDALDPAVGDSVRRDREASGVNDLAEQFDATWLRFRAAVDDLGEAQMESPTRVGWTAKEMLGHLGFWLEATEGVIVGTSAASRSATTSHSRAATSRIPTLPGLPPTSTMPVKPRGRGREAQQKWSLGSTQGTPCSRRSSSRCAPTSSRTIDTGTTSTTCAPSSTHTSRSSKTCSRPREA
jgi:Mycothiol maleylpyruvate isomerase N-terminal domain